MRPRIKVQRAYSSSRNYNNDSAGFRPEGFGAALQSDGGQQRSYRPRYNSGQQGGYQQRQGYQPQQRGGYRPRYNSDADGNYQPRQNQYGQRQGSPYRQNYNQGMDGGYQPRQSAGYRPRYNNGGGESGYQPRQNSYQRGGYGPQRQPAYQQRGGYRQRTPDYDPNAKYSQKKRIEYKEANIDPTVPVRLNKYLANAGICSRREADEFIQAGVVSVNGQVVTELGTKVLRTDDIRFHDQKVSMEKKVYVLLNKPKDCVTTSDDPQQRKTVMDLVKTHVWSVSIP